MNEIYKVLKTGGTFESFTPAFPKEAAWRDPTHVNIITEQTFPLYFDDKIGGVKITDLLVALKSLIKNGIQIIAICKQ